MAPMIEAGELDVAAGYRAVAPQVGHEPGPTDGDPRPVLANRHGVDQLVTTFYRRVAMDDLLGPIFNDVAAVDWSVHVPKLIDYWCRVLLREPGYDGAILGPHQRVNEMESFTHEMFDRWFELFTDTVEADWSGPLADQAVVHAERIGGVLSRQIMGTKWVSDAQS